MLIKNMNINMMNKIINMMDEFLKPKEFENQDTLDCYTRLLELKENSEKEPPIAKSKNVSRN